MITKTNQSGRSMIEMLGVLAIIGVLSVGGIAGYSKAMQKYRTNKTIDQITQIANGVHMLYGTRPNYAGLNIAVLGKAKIIPQELIEETTQNLISRDEWGEEHPQPPFNAPNNAYQKWIDLEHDSCPNDYCTTTTTTQTFHGTNPFGGKILLSVEDNAKAFSLNYLGLPEDACIDLLTQDWGTTDLIAAGVDSQISSTQGCTGDKGSHVCNNQLPVSVDKAMTLCEQQTDSKGVILKFK
ncbi:MAG: hypothetical protein IJ852_01395 [Alphaproteobacteria bacterium]|nr:hypothetical protein [Alphaproteobacteria bacterium]